MFSSLLVSVILICRLGARLISSLSAWTAKTKNVQAEVDVSHPPPPPPTLPSPHPKKANSQIWLKRGDKIIREHEYELIIIKKQYKAIVKDSAGSKRCYWIPKNKRK